MSQQVNIDIQVAVAKEILTKPDPKKPIQNTQINLLQFDHNLEQRRLDALKTKEQNRLKNDEVRARVLQQKRLQNKYKIFSKIFPTIEKELQVLKIEMQNQNEYQYKHQRFYKLTRSQSYPNKMDYLRRFQQNLFDIRRSTCYYKYCEYSQCSSCLFWTFCFWTFPCYCYQSGCLKESKSQGKLRQLYERYEALMEQEQLAKR